MDESSSEDIRIKDCSSPSSSSEHPAHPVVYKLVRVDGDGKLVPATVDEVMDVEDFLEDDKSGRSLDENLGLKGGCNFEGASSVRSKQCDKGTISLGDNEMNLNNELDARIEFIEEMLEKVKQEERLWLSSGSPNRAKECDNRDDCPIHGPKMLEDCILNNQSECSSQNVKHPLSIPLDCAEGSTSIYQDQTHEPVSKDFSVSDCSPSEKVICLDNLSTKELHETFKATFGRETFVKNKSWLKRRIAMGLTNSYNVSTMNFIIKGKTLIPKSVESIDCRTGNGDLSTDQLAQPLVLAKKRGRRHNVEFDEKSEGLVVDHSVVKRIRKPTKRYIEELSEGEARECSGCVAPVPKAQFGTVMNVRKQRSVFVTRPDSLGGHSVQIPYVSRVRRGRPRHNFMTLMVAHEVNMPKDSTRSFGERQELEVAMDSGENTSEGHISTGSTAKDSNRRKHHRAWTMCEVMKLVDGVSRCGAGRWSEIKRLAFASYTYRTSVDLKDKWRNLLRASLSQLDAKKGVRDARKHAYETIPTPILVRVRELAEMQHDHIAMKVTTHKRNVHERDSDHL